MSGNAAIGDIAFDLAHSGGESLLFLTSSPDETLQRAAAFGSVVGKTILMKPSPLPSRSVMAAGGAREWLASPSSATRRQEWHKYARDAASGIQVRRGVFLSKDAVKALQAETDVVRAKTTGNIALYELRSEKPSRAIITLDPEKITAAVNKVLTEKAPDSVQPDEPEDRYLEVDTERQVAMNSTIRINVRIAATPPAATPAELVKLLIPSVGLPATIVVDGGPGLKPLDNTAGMLTVMRGTDTPWLLFRFKALHRGKHEINVRLFTGGALTATMNFELFVEETPTAENELREAIKFRDRGRDEVSLNIHFDASACCYRYLWIDPYYSFPLERVSGKLTAARSDLVTNTIGDLNKIARGTVKFDGDVLRQYLKSRGVQLWQELIPEDMQRDFWDRRVNARKLTLHTGADPMLWEVLYPEGEGDDQGFLIEQMQVARWGTAPVPPARLTIKQSLIVVPASGSPKAALTEAEELKELLSTRGPVEIVQTLRELLAKLREPTDVIHFACHNTFTPAGSQIKFPDGILDAPLLRTTKKLQSTLVFVNACRSDGVAQTYTGLTSWATEFIRIGAAGFIGSLWEVTDATAPRLARTFYERLLAGDQISIAMQHARQSIQAHADPTWLAYTLYADPTAVVT